MKRKPTVNFRHASALFAHVLSCLLLASIIYGSTAGLTHHHGSASLRVVSGTVGMTGAVSASEQTGSTTGGALRERDCSICQLQQQLNSGLLYAPVFTPAPPAQQATISTTSVRYLSASNAPQRGRAPPQISL